MWWSPRWAATVKYRLSSWRRFLREWLYFGEVSENTEEALKKAHEEKGDDGMLFCVGSLYLVGEIKTAILKGIGK